VAFKTKQKILDELFNIIEVSGKNRNVSNILFYLLMEIKQSWLMIGRHGDY
jgi:hypothetical protein